MLVKYSCADLNTEDVRAGEGQRDQISKACPDLGEDAAGCGGEGVWRKRRTARTQVQDRYRAPRSTWELGRVTCPLRAFDSSTVVRKRGL